MKKIKKIFFLNAVILSWKGIAGLGVSKTGRVAARALILYFSTTVMAVILGLILVSSIKPGTLNRDSSDDGMKIESDAAKLNTADTFLDLFRNLIPDNLIEMCFQMYASDAVAETAFNETSNETYIDYYIAKPSSRRGLNVLGLVVFCATFGAMLASLGERGQPMITFFEILNEVSIKIIRLVMWYTSSSSSFILKSFVSLNFHFNNDFNKHALIWNKNKKQQQKGSLPLVFFRLFVCLYWRWRILRKRSLAYHSIWWPYLQDFLYTVLEQQKKY